MLKYLYYMPWIITSAAIIYLSHQETIEFLDGQFMFEDKILHFFAYMFYGITIQIALINSKNYKTKKFIWTVIIIGSLFGASDEFHQSFIKGRSMEFLDWVADSLGVVASLIFKNLIIWAKSRLMG